MLSLVRTTVVLTPKAQDIKARHVNAFGLKKMLSAALYLFDRLSDGERIELVSQVTIDELQEKTKPSGTLSQAPMGAQASAAARTAATAAASAGTKRGGTRRGKKAKSA